MRRFVIRIIVATVLALPGVAIGATPQREELAWAQWLVADGGGKTRAFVVIARDVTTADGEFSEVTVEVGPCATGKGRMRCDLRRHTVQLGPDAFRVDPAGATVRFRWRGRTNVVEWFDAEIRRGAYVSECSGETNGAGAEAHSGAKGEILGTRLSQDDNADAAIFTGVGLGCP